MTMKTPEQWLDENDPAWQDVCGEQPVLTKEIVASIQADARADLLEQNRRMREILDNCIHTCRKGMGIGIHLPKDCPACRWDAIRNEK